MSEADCKSIIQDFRDFIDEESYPCVAAKAAVKRGHIPCYVAGDMRCPKDDALILKFLYDFIKRFRKDETSYHSAAVIFTGPSPVTEQLFETLLWERLQALLENDAQNCAYDPRVSPDPASSNFSFSLSGEALFIIGLHPASARRARQFKYPAIVFNPHVQFEQLREKGQYLKMKKVVRKRDDSYSGSINPMLDDFGASSEAKQYSGRLHDDRWTCPLTVVHGKSESNSTKK